MGRAQKLKQQRKEEQVQKEKEARKDIYRKVAIVVAVILVIAATVALVFLVNSLKKKEAEKAESAKQLILETTKGEIVIDLFTADAPLTVEHISTLVDQGFYNNLRWYRVEEFVVQTGSHYASLVYGVEGQPDQAQLDQALQEDQAVGTVLDEVSRPNLRGSIAMAKQSSQQSDAQAPQTPQYVPNSARTDFFILKTDASWLDNDFTVFGKVVKGMEVVDALETTDILNSAQVRNK